MPTPLECVQQACVGADRACPPHHVPPEPGSVFEEDRVGISLDGQPVAPVDLAAQLAGRPARVARKETNAARWAVEQRIDRVRLQREVEPREHRDGFTGKLVGPEYREQSLQRDRSAEEYRLGEGLEALARQQLGERAVGGAVDDHAGRLRALVLGDQHHGFPEVRVGQSRSSDEEKRAGGALRANGGGKEPDGEREKRRAPGRLHPGRLRRYSR